MFKKCVFAKDFYRHVITFSVFNFVNCFCFCFLVLKIPVFACVFLWLIYVVKTDMSFPEISGSTKILYRPMLFLDSSSLSKS